MSLAQEIREALAAHPKSPASVLWKHCPTAESANQVATNLAPFVARKEAVMERDAEGRRLFTLNPQFVRVRGVPGAFSPKARQPDPTKPGAANRPPTLRAANWEQLVRPGGLDYRLYPSRSGDQRFPYHL